MCVPVRQVWSYFFVCRAMLIPFGLLTLEGLIAAAAAAPQADVERFCRKTFRQGRQIGDDQLFPFRKEIENLLTTDTFEMSMVT